MHEVKGVTPALTKLAQSYVMTRDNHIYVTHALTKSVLINLLLATYEVKLVQSFNVEYFTFLK